MFSDLCSVAGQLYKFGIEGYRNNFDEDNEANLKNNQTFKKKNKATKTQYRVCVHGDEFNEIANDDVTTLLNKGGGAGLQLTLYTQTWSDVEAKLGNKAKAGQVGGNLNTIVCLRVIEEATARFFTDKVGQKATITTLVPASSASDSSQSGTEFNVSNEDRLQTLEVSLIEPRDLMQLPKGQAYCLIEGNQLWKMRLPLTLDKMHDIPQSIEYMVTAMQQKHAQNDLTFSDLSVAV
jgi:type IV secretory pathway TraG/TraD family ATPase VirD4